jgi:F5/8 type C domain
VLVSLLLAGLVGAATVTLGWDAPQDVSTVTGYRIHWGTAPGQYTHLLDVPVGQSQVPLVVDPATPLYVVMTSLSGRDESDFSNEIQVSAAAPSEVALPWHALTLRADSAEVAQVPNGAEQASDGQTGTIWHTPWNGVPPYPHQLTAQLSGRYSVVGLTMTPRQDGNLNGMLAAYQVYTSLDGQSWQLQASGTWAGEPSAKTLRWAPVPAAYVRLQGLGGDVQGKHFASVAELTIRVQVTAAPDAPGQPSWRAN